MPSSQNVRELARVFEEQGGAGDGGWLEGRARWARHRARLSALVLVRTWGLTPSEPRIPGGDLRVNTCPLVMAGGTCMGRGQKRELGGGDSQTSVGIIGILDLIWR